jgi:hypothetical protein
VHLHKRKNKFKLNFAENPDTIIETDITYILQTWNDIFNVLKGCIFKGMDYNTSCTAKDAINAVDNSITGKYKGNVPEGLIIRDNGQNIFQRNSINI